MEQKNSAFGPLFMWWLLYCKIDCTAVVRCTPKLAARLEITAVKQSLTVHNSFAIG